MKATTQTQLNKLLASITALHEASQDYKAELHKFKPMYDKATPQDKTLIRNAVAQLIGKLYKVKPIMLKTGVLGFERSSAESKALRRVLPVDRVSTTSGTTRKSIDPVQATAKRIKAKFSKTEINRLVKALTQNA